MQSSSVWAVELGRTKKAEWSTKTGRSDGEEKEVIKTGDCCTLIVFLLSCSLFIYSLCGASWLQWERWDLVKQNGATSCITSLTGVAVDLRIDLCPLFMDRRIIKDNIMDWHAPVFCWPVVKTTSGEMEEEKEEEEEEWETYDCMQGRRC